MNNFIFYVLIACLITWGSTALGAATIFFVKKFNQKVMDGMLGFAAGVMISASFFSLLIPAMEFSKEFNPNVNEMIVVSIGFLCGALFLLLIDVITPHLHIFEKEPEGPKSNLKRSWLLLLAITIHNIPEGLAVGIALGAYHISGNDISLLNAAMALAVGMAIQNFPEGAAISFPLHREGVSKKKSFLFGQASAIVEPIGIVVGIILIQLIQPILPFALAFAAGAMMFVVIEELIPESQKAKNTNLSTMFTIIGLMVMMVLDVLLG
ncbi:ZIP family zinc transporter [Bacilli bacterium PM5-3]|nr:ZIP family zinc transporter [Bacilli bacterium PM5-3]MDH6603113.1 ZIP family zinc transporter [Bacilli bacterium PM5-9]